MELDEMYPLAQSVFPNCVDQGDRGNSSAAYGEIPGEFYDSSLG
jgi:hypothetical protein